MLKVVQIQLSGKSAGSSAVRLHEGLLAHGSVDSSIVSLFEDSLKPVNVTYLSRFAQLKAVLSNKLEKRKISYDSSRFGLFSYPILGTDVTRLKVIQQADVIYIHWVQMGFFNYNSLEKLFKLNKKIYIVLHDMWFMTGGCHYAVNLSQEQCKGFEKNCEACPIFSEEKTFSYDQHRVKLNLISTYGHKLQFISPSRWLKKLGETSTILKDQKIHFIPNYFNSTHFRPASQRISRESLSIEESKRVLCFGAVSISSVYKGWPYLKQAFAYLESVYAYEQLEVIIFGNGNIEEFRNSIPYKIHYLGYLEEEETISLAYKCADVFVIPSVLDNQPTTIAESLHCGIPVVGFDLCGIPEMIEHKQTGYIAEAYNAYDLSMGIRYCLDHDLSGKLKKEYRYEQVLTNHLNLLTVHGCTH
ncbi:glycosyltransferase [Algoriphagus sp.]|uniref:glycosyltransferase n=1 Tax=Algoriphagus sp. TaxID=1872435 RepID=UPI003F72266B